MRSHLLSILPLLVALTACGGGEERSERPVPPPATTSVVERSDDADSSRAELPREKRSRPLKLTPRRLQLDGGKTITLDVPEDFRITVAASGLRRVRFMASSPDRRIFVTDMHDLSDNRKGTIYILDRFDSSAGRFLSVVPYLTHLRNPNNIAFHTDPSGTTWLYVALTDSLVRYRYRAGDVAPSSPPEFLTTFPDYGLSYKYGGWHLTRTVVIGPNGKLYVAVGSSCNACVEKEDVRAAVLEMDLDGGNRRIYASGLRNAVGLKFVGRELYATNMGADHLGDDKPEDQLLVLDDGANYGWPYFYQYRGRIYDDPQFRGSAGRPDRENVPLAGSTFRAHSAPLGLEYFDSTASSPDLENSMLVALHGASKLSLRHGYSVARVRPGEPTLDFIGGFLRDGKVQGRPADVMRVGNDAFLVTDDHAGAIYYLREK